MLRSRTFRRPRAVALMTGMGFLAISAEAEGQEKRSRADSAARDSTLTARDSARTALQRVRITAGRAPATVGTAGAVVVSLIWGVLVVVALVALTMTVGESSCKRN